MEFFKNMAIYVEVVRAKSFRRAAEVLGMPNSTVSRRIAELEKAVGLRLLNRTTRTVELTGEGRIYYERCRRIVEEARLAHEALRDMHEQPTGVLRASLPVDFSVVFLAPLLADFARQYPGISFDLDLTPRRANLVSDPVDVAIRVGEQGDPGVISRQIASLSIELYASPAYLEAAGIPRSPEDLLQHQCLRIRAMDWSLYRGESRITLPVTGRFVVNNVGMLRRLSLLGVGIAALAGELIQQELAQGELVRILPDWHLDQVSVYAITETRLLPAKTRLFIDYLMACFRSGLGNIHGMS